MALEHILEKIRTEAESQAEELMKEASKEAARLRAEEEGRIAAASAAAVAEGRKRLEDEKRSALALKRLEAKNGLLRKKHEILEGVFSQAFEKIMSLPAGEYMELMLKLIIESAPAGGGLISIAGKDRKRLGPDFISKLNSRLKESGHPGGYELGAEDAEISGGFVLKAGNISIKADFDGYFGSLRERLEPEVARLLFSQGTQP